MLYVHINGVFKIRSEIKTNEYYKIKDLGSSLIANMKKILESFGDDKGHRLYFSLEKGIGSDGRAHSNPLDQKRIERLI